jgi:multisubunit Na+/H+ antiporter MnhF subunit
MMLSVAAGLFLLRVWRGPTLLDRILAFDGLVIAGVALLLVWSAQEHNPHYLELILIYSLLGFFGTAAFALFLTRRVKDPVKEENGS